MDARETTVKSLLEGEKIFVIPLYQRRYSWREADWQQLWRAIKTQLENLLNHPEYPSHFLGSFVYSSKQLFATEAPNFELIDGQQRLGTIQILLAALRDEASDETLRTKISSSITNAYEPNEILKFKAGEDDLASFTAILCGNPDQANGLPRDAYYYFKERIAEIREQSDRFDANLILRASTERLDIVQIVTGQDDNAHRIFQTLNSTGRDLTAVDLLRNHFFMLLPDEVDVAYVNYWRPMEVNLAARFQKFLWADLITRPGLSSIPEKTDAIYDAWQEILDPIAGNQAQVLRELTDLHDKSVSFLSLFDPDTGNDDLDRTISSLMAWGSETHLPLSLLIMDRVRTNHVSSEEASTCLHFIQSFMCRRMLCGIPTNNLNSIFSTTVGQLCEEFSSDFSVRLRRALSQPGKYWPSDEVVAAQVLTQRFYELQRATQRQFILRRLEEEHSKPYRPDWDTCSFTIEHIMPQTPSDWWLSHLREQGEEYPLVAHEELQHTLGNLTLTCENPQLGAMTFPEKSSIYQSDIVRMNSDIASNDSWGRTEIRVRGERLAQLAVSLWAGPLEAGHDSDEFAGQFEVDEEAY